MLFSNAILTQADQNENEDEDSEDDMVDVNDIKSYEAPGALLNKSRETLGSNSSAKIYDNVPKTPPRSSDQESYLHADEEGAHTDSDGERNCVFPEEIYSCSNTGSIRDDPYWTSRENSLEVRTDRGIQYKYC